jgi:hypothetical protein
MPKKPKFKPGAFKSLGELAGLRQQLADQEFEALKAAQEKAAMRQQIAGQTAAREADILNKATGIRTASSGRMHFTRGKNGSGVYAPVMSSGIVRDPKKPYMTPFTTAEEIPTTKIYMESSTDPFTNVNQSIQNAYDAGLPGLQSMFEADRRAMHAPLLERLMDRTGTSEQTILRAINPETGQIKSNYFRLYDPTKQY